MPYFRTGDISILQVDAVVNSTNETMDDNSSMCQKIFARAGSPLKMEIFNETKGTICFIKCHSINWQFCFTRNSYISECKTGEVRVTQGHGLPARFIIHTVGPVYNVKYQTAAQNTLHCCYR